MHIVPQSLIRPSLILSLGIAMAASVALEDAFARADDAVEVKKNTAAASDTTSMKLSGGEEGTLFESLRVEGEDRMRIRFDRPNLELLLDAQSAPGLEWKSVRDVIDRIGVDMISPLLAGSAGERPQCYSRPWLNTFSTDAVARFRPALEGVDKWRLLVADSKGDTVASFEGKGKPPKEIAWDGRSLDGDYVVPGLVYSYVLEAYDRAGNKRNFVGEGFELRAYRVDDRNHVMMFSGGELAKNAASWGGTPLAPVILLEAASWLNQEKDLSAPVTLEITARDFRDAKHIADEITRQLTPLLLGDPLRVRTVTNVEADAPERGAVAIVVTR